VLARDARVSQATAYRYLHEAIDVIAEHAPDLASVLAAGAAAGWAFVCLDGTLIETSRCSARSAAGGGVVPRTMDRSRGQPADGPPAPAGPTASAAPAGFARRRSARQQMPERGRW